MRNKRQNVLIQVLAFMFVAIGAASLYNAIIDSDLKPALTSFVIMCFSGFIGLHMGKSDEDKKDPDDFLIKLQENSEKINNGGWLYGENLITPCTIITQYFFNVSLVTVSFKVRSRFYIVGKENTTFINSIYTLFSFLLGWWSIPTGPLDTISTLTNNIRGGNKLNVGEFIGA